MIVGETFRTRNGLMMVVRKTTLTEVLASVVKYPFLGCLRYNHEGERLPLGGTDPFDKWNGENA